jgi:hypothetical protein
MPEPERSSTGADGMPDADPSPVAPRAGRPVYRVSPDIAVEDPDRDFRGVKANAMTSYLTFASNQVTTCDCSGPQ